MPGVSQLATGLQLDPGDLVGGARRRPSQKSRDLGPQGEGDVRNMTGGLELNLLLGRLPRLQQRVTNYVLRCPLPKGEPHSGTMPEQTPGSSKETAPNYGCPCNLLKAAWQGP